MSRASGSVRIGPISLFTLVIVLSLAVMAVLAVATSQATFAAAQKQALFATDTYANETEAQRFVAEVDAALAEVRASGESGLQDAYTAVDRMLPANATREDSLVKAVFTAESGRTLEVGLTIKSNATYEISFWKATTHWTDTGSGETLWPGPANTREENR